MNSDSQPVIPPEIEVRITALLLGELPEDEATALQEQLRQNPEWALFHERMRQTLDLVREATRAGGEHAVPPTAGHRLTSARRRTLLAVFKTAPTPPSQPKLLVGPRPWLRRFPRSLVWAVAACLAAAAVWPFFRPRQILKTAALSDRALPMAFYKAPQSFTNIETPQALESLAERPETEVKLARRQTLDKAAAASANELFGVVSSGTASAPAAPASLPESAAAPLSRPLSLATTTPARPARPASGGMGGASSAFGGGVRALSTDRSSGAVNGPAGGRQPAAIAGKPTVLAASVPADQNGRENWGFNRGNRSESELPAGADLTHSYQLASGTASTAANLPGLSSVAGVNGVAAKDDLERATTAPSEPTTTRFYAGGGGPVQLRLGDEPVLGSVFRPSPAETDAEKKERGLAEVSDPREAGRKVTADALSIAEEDRKGVDDFSIVEAKSAVALKQKVQAPEVETLGRSKAKFDNAKLRGAMTEARLEDETRLGLAKRRLQESPAPTVQPEVAATENAFSTFSLNVSDVSFRLAAASLKKGLLPAKVSVRTEEFINAFDYHDPQPSPGTPIGFAWDRSQYPFEHRRELVRFALKTAARGRETGRPLNLVVLLDNSGSMERADRVETVRAALRTLAAQLKPQDRVSVVAFSRTARLWVDGLPGSDVGRFLDQTQRLAPEGGTNLEEAMTLGYATALRHFIPSGLNRVALFTDGAANLGNVDPTALQSLVEAHRLKGVALDCFGIGWEGLNDPLLETLSSRGDGRYGFLNNAEEAASRFAAQLAGALEPAAGDVKVQVEFNPGRVRSWRQLGYAKHQLTREQFRDNTVDAAELAAAEAGNALYVLDVDAGGQGPLATVRVRYKEPATGQYREWSWVVAYQGAAPRLEDASPAVRLACAAAGFGEWLLGSPFTSEITPAKLHALVGGVAPGFDPDPRPRLLETMLQQAMAIGGRP